MSDEHFPFSLSHLPAVGWCCGELPTWMWWPYPEWQLEFQRHPWQPWPSEVMDTVATMQRVAAATAATPGSGEQILLSSCSTGGSSSHEFLHNFHEFQEH